ncbi:MAG TPA: tetratricopeptide repeat protein [Flavobacteriales bacterium]|nr:tetratricopeptide repeat protein [Flavobacteriales bacterium]
MVRLRFSMVLLLFSFFIAKGQAWAVATNVTKQQSHLNKADNYYESDNFSKALTAYQAALNEAERVNDSLVLFRACFKIGIIHAKNGNPGFAINYFNRAKTIAVALREPLFISDCYLSLGNLANARRDFKSARENFNTALSIAAKAGDSARMALCHNNLGVLYNTMKNVNRAKHYYELALAYDEKQNNAENTVTGLANVGGCYIRLHQGQKAMAYMQKAIALSNSIHSPDLKQKVYEAFSNAWYEVGNYEKALQYYRMHARLKDSVFNAASNKRIAELESKYEFEKRQREIAQLRSMNEKGKIKLEQSENKLNRQTALLWFVVSVLVLILAFGTLFYYQYRQKIQMNRDLMLKNNEVIQQKKLIEENLEYTQKLRDALAHDLNHYMQLALSKQMNPHFIFNSLNSIQSYILQNNRVEANAYLSKFAELMRKVLENSHHEYVTVQEELSTLELYIELEQKRFDYTFDYIINIHDAGIATRYVIPPLILQPYVENAIWHGLMHLEGKKGVLEIIVEKTGEHIAFTISDNGIGREAAGKVRKNRKHVSLGTTITSRRLEIMNSLNAKNMVVEYTDIKNESGGAAGTKVTLTVPAMYDSKLKHALKENP